MNKTEKKMKKVNLYSWNNLVLLCNNRRSWGIVNTAACKNKNIHLRKKIMLNHQIFIFTFFFSVYFLYFFGPNIFCAFFIHVLTFSYSLFPLKILFIHHMFIAMWKYDSNLTFLTLKWHYFTKGKSSTELKSWQEN